MCRCIIQKSSFVKDITVVPVAACLIEVVCQAPGQKNEHMHDQDCVHKILTRCHTNPFLSCLKWWFVDWADFWLFSLIFLHESYYGVHKNTHTHVHVAFLILQARLVLCISWGYINQISVWAMCCSKATNSVNYLTTHTHARARTDACIYAIQTPLWNSEILERGNLVHSAAFAGIRPQEWQELGAKEE